MSAFLTGLGGKLAERWATLLVLPGLLYLGVAAAAAVLGHRTSFGIGQLRLVLDQAAASPAGRSPGVIILICGGVLIGSAAAGLVAQAVGSALERWWLTSSTGPFTFLTTRRKRRRQAAHEAFQQALVTAGRAQLDPAAHGDGNADPLRLNAARNKISLAEPQRATWIGDRLAAVEHRVHAVYDLDLVSAWPRLWLVLPEEMRDELRRAHSAFDASARLTGWGIGYLVMAIWWWPAAIIGPAVIITGWRRSRATAAAFAELVEAAIDVRGRDLATSLGLDCPGPFTREAGEAITHTLRKNT